MALQSTDIFLVNRGGTSYQMAFSGMRVPNSLTAGSYLSGGSFDGSAAVSFNVQASSANVADRVVVRNSVGAFAMGALTVEGTSRFDQTTQFVEDIDVGTEIRSAAYRIDQLPDKSSFAANDVFLVNSSTQPGKSFSVTYSTLQAQLGGGGSLWYAVGGNAIRPILPNTGINLTGGGAFGGTVSSGAFTTTGNLTVGNLSTLMGNVTCQSSLTANGDIVAGSSLGAGLNVTAGSTFYGLQLLITRNGEADNPAIRIGNTGSGNIYKMTLWSDNDGVNIGQDTEPCIMFTGRNTSSSTFRIRYGIQAGSSGTPMNVNGNGFLFKTPSTREAKRDIEDLDVDVFLDVLDRARMVSFKWKEPYIINEEGDTHDPTEMGMIAEELYEIDPRFVVKDPETDKFESINYQLLTLPLIHGYREQKKEILELKGAITSLNLIVARMDERLQALEAG